MRGCTSIIVGIREARRWIMDRRIVSKIAQAQKTLGARKFKTINRTLERIDSNTTSLGVVHSDGSDRHLTSKCRNLSEEDRDWPA
jgi:hypothetical protein